ncbi:right-handed parallel beta-helix repeat-containing protein [soil metagenome]
MKKVRFGFQLSAFIFCLFVFSTAVQAQATRTWVSGVGDDLNPCSRTAPCKTFAGAISKTATNGEINCLDAGGFGAVTVTKSITIDCSDVPSSILAAGTNGVIVNITSGTDTLKTFRIRGISINGAATGINGIRILAANSVFIEDMIIDGFTQHGISVENSTPGATKIVISRATISNNTGNGFNTFIVGGASATLSVSDSLFAVNNIGFNLSQAVKSTFQNSIINGNNTGVLVNVGELTMTNCQISQNGTGVQAGSGGIIRIAGNSITSNTTGLSGSTIISFGNNLISGNTTNGTPTSTLPLN